ncbi:Radical SAM domain protein [Desulfobulbus propionicus DSM 2032]|uniref:Radical SAM domain protein n=1 Tax=Desulfobulbus propionicus (strain ATCC 33891 / DSM 2032 / VKM B-1956 / 1pr3) TaxID=577650 RepID=A0A7U3YIZ9_DESPD|nr:radical SAM protein [Desulfobulbus propionicus]ADW16264.1 Radical SAM domain protein [Desulfobulbus propionicus DSM 2032]
MPLVIPIFIPHEGCPHRCIFCDQRRISGQVAPPVDSNGVAETIRVWLARSRPDRRERVQVALYGGSFTGLPVERQRELLAAVQPFRRHGLVQEIRLSTRPDLIDSGRLDLLEEYGVSIVELGAQSCDDRVLRLAGRGHGGAAVEDAARQLRERGFGLGIQLMLGLPGDSFRILRQTVATVVSLRPAFVRLYPVLVVRGSGLERLYHRGGYRPLSLGRAVVLTAYMKKRFDDQGIGVVRMGLQPSPELERAVVAGPYHPAFGELVKARLMLRQARRLLAGVQPSTPVTLVIAERDQSIFRGPRSANLERLRQLGLLDRFVLRADPNQPRQAIAIGG